MKFQNGQSSGSLARSSPTDRLGEVLELLAFHFQVLSPALIPHFLFPWSIQWSLTAAARDVIVQQLPLHPRRKGKSHEAPGEKPRSIGRDRPWALFFRSQPQQLGVLDIQKIFP